MLAKLSERAHVALARYLAQKAVKQGAQDRTITAALKTIVDAAREQYTEDSPAGLNAYLRERFEAALREGRASEVTHAVPR